MTSQSGYKVEEQKNRAKLLFGIYCFLLVVFVFGFLVYTLGFFGVDLKNEGTKEGRQLLVWTFAALSGSCAYLITNITYFYRRIGDKDIAKRADFIMHTFWYVSTLLRAPILAIVVLWMLTNIDIKIAGDVQSTAQGLDIGTGISFKGLPEIVLSGLAFILGYYSRVTLQQLNLITKAIFPRAWALAEQGFEISSAPKELLLKEQNTFTTEPQVDVVWSTSDGSIDAKTGIYTAPDDVSKADTNAKIIASLRSEPSANSYKDVKLKLFKIVTDKEKVVTGQKDVKLSLETKIDGVKFDDATWISSDVKFKPDKGKEVKFEAPAKEGNVKVEAKLTHDKKEYTASLTIQIEKA